MKKKKPQHTKRKKRRPKKKRVILPFLLLSVSRCALSVSCSPFVYCFVCSDFFFLSSLSRARLNTLVWRTIELNTRRWGQCVCITIHLSLISKSFQLVFYSFFWWEIEKKNQTQIDSILFMQKLIKLICIHFFTASFWNRGLVCLVSFMPNEWMWEKERQSEIERRRRKQK